MYNDEGTLEFYGYEASWYVIRQDISSNNINTLIKRKVRVLLKPVSATLARDIDCKLLQLFKDEIITWDALQKLVYSDCKL